MQESPYTSVYATTVPDDCRLPHTPWKAMVGVPGKSKGCSTCRRRKKGCDQKRPTCGQCLTGGYDCGGYARERTFILHPASRTVEQAVFVPYLKVSASRLLQSLEEDAISAECQELFWDLYMPQGDCVEDDITLNWGHPMKWLEVVNELPCNESSLKNAFSALILSRVSKESKDQQLDEASTLLYGNALQDLQAALLDPERIYSDDILIASLLLAVYEVFQGSTVASSSWLSHAQGAARLIELRGPERHRTDQAHQAFLASRITTIYASIVQKKACYLAIEEWRTIPWESQHRTYFDRLVDIATDLPGLLERIECLRPGSPSDRAQKSRALLQELLAMQKAIKTWKRYIKKEAVAQEIKHTASEDGDSYPYDTKYWFDNHVFANAACLYHTFSFVVCEAIETLLHATQAANDDQVDFRKVCDAENHATSITKILPYCLQPDMGGLGVCIVNFPGNLAFRYFLRTGNSAASLWLATVLNEASASERHSEPIAQNVRNPQVGCDRPTFSPGNRSESSDSASEFSRKSTPSGRRPSHVMVKFVYEDPSRYYTDTSGYTSGDPSQVGELPVRSRQPP